MRINEGDFADIAIYAVSDIINFMRIYEYYQHAKFIQHSDYRSFDVYGLLLFQTYTNFIKFHF